jgi:general stress protein CsbA
VKMASDGVWQGENPLDFALPLLAVQIAVILAVTQGLALALRPLRQPKVVAEILVHSSFISFLYICVVLFWRTTGDNQFTSMILTKISLACNSKNGYKHNSCVCFFKTLLQRLLDDTSTNITTLKSTRPCFVVCHICNNIILPPYLI